MAYYLICTSYNSFQGGNCKIRPPKVPEIYYNNNVLGLIIASPPKVTSCKHLFHLIGFGGGKY